jgi:hypothetical protein
MKRETPEYSNINDIPYAEFLGSDASVVRARQTARNDLRKSPRIQEKANVYSRVQSSPEALDLTGRIFSCYSSDVSFEGIQMCVDTEMSCGAILEMDIIFSNSPGRLLQIGNVIWCDGFVDEILEGCYYNIGVRFETVTKPWEWAVSKLFEPEKKTS